MMAHMKVDRNFKVTIVLDPGDEGYENECAGSPDAEDGTCSCYNTQDETAEERNQRMHDESHARFDAECERKGI